MFSYEGSDAATTAEAAFFPGVAIDMVNARGLEKHAVLAMEAGKVVWVETRFPGTAEPKAAVCIESGSTPGLYYLYRNLYNRNLMVSRNQELEKGDPIGTIWGDGNRENLHLAVVRSETAPTPETADHNIVNFYPQLLELYYGRQPLNSQLFTKGQILFGKPAGPHGNVKNASAYEDYLGMGWILGEWNTTGKVEWITGRQNGNVRLPGYFSMTGKPAVPTPIPGTTTRSTSRTGCTASGPVWATCSSPPGKGWNSRAFRQAPSPPPRGIYLDPRKNRQGQG